MNKQDIKVGMRVRILGCNAKACFVGSKNGQCSAAMDGIGIVQEIGLFGDVLVELGGDPTCYFRPEELNPVEES